MRIKRHAIHGNGAVEGILSLAKAVIGRRHAVVVALDNLRSPANFAKRRQVRFRKIQLWDLRPEVLNNYGIFSKK